MRLAIVCFILGLGSSAFAKDLSALVKKSGLDAKNFSLLVKKHNAETPSYELNSKETRIPASLTKLITASAVLSEFPAGHQFVTELRTDSSGNLYLVGDGDPGFVSESMWILVNNFLRSEVKTIKGDLVVDDSKFDKIRFDSSRNDKRVDRAYDSPVGAMSFNWNAVNIYVRPGKSKGDSLKVFADPDSQYFKIVNKAKTGSGTQNTIQIKLEKENSKDSPHQELVTITGEYGKQLKEKVYFKAVDNPELWSLYNLKSFLERRGIKIEGNLRTGRPPMSSKEVAQFKSHPLSRHVSGMMKFSNNYIAEMLIKNLAAYKGVRPATLDSGVNYLRTFLTDNGVRDFRLVNPSGLSRENSFTTVQLMKLLEKMRSNFKVYPELSSSLPIAGVDGTLKSRMNSLGNEAKLRAKTGMLNGVAGLAGYTNKYSFVFMYNGPHGDLYKARDLFDQMGVELANN